jgi:hypothetical protein
MSDERMDELLEEALATGDVRGDATADERAEIERLLEAARLLAATRHATEREAEAALLAARTRFQRHVGARPPSALDAISRPRMLPWGRRMPRQATWALAGAAGVVAVVALAAVLLWTNLSEPESAYAQVVEPGDYVQVEGVVEARNGAALSVRSALGEVEVEVDDETTVVIAAEPTDLATVNVGDELLVSGVAGDRKLRAQTLAITGERGRTVPQPLPFRPLERLRTVLEGHVVTYTLSSDGTHGSVLIDAAGAGSYLVRVDGASAARLLERASTALGQRVRVTQESGVTSGTFTLELAATPPSPTGTPGDGQTPQGQRDRPELVSVRGVVAGVSARRSTDAEHILEGIVSVQTARGTVEVVVRATTRILPGESGLTRGAGLRGEANGHGIFVSGGIDKGTGHLVADVIVLGPKAERPGRR